MKPNISVLMPAYNAGRYIGDSIASILNQTAPDFEFIIINDGSTDDTAQIVARCNDPRIRYFENDGNLGIARTYNRAIDLARGEYLAIAEADDINHPRRLEISRDFLRRRPHIDVVSGRLANFQTKPPKFERIGRVPVFADWMAARCGPVFGELLTRHAAQMMRADALKKHNAKYETQYKICCDLSLIMQLLPHVKMAVLKPRLTLYREHASNTSGNLQNLYAEANDLTNRYLKSQFGLETDLAFWNAQAVSVEYYRTAVEEIRRILDAASAHAGYDAAVLRRSAGDAAYRIFRQLYDSGLSHQEVFDIYKKSPIIRRAQPAKIRRIYMKYLAAMLSGKRNRQLCPTGKRT